MQCVWLFSCLLAEPINKQRIISRGKSLHSVPIIISPLRQLINILTKSVDTIEAHAIAQNASYPTLSEYFDPTSPGQQLAMTPEVVEAATLGAAAAAQLVANLKNTGMVIFDRLSAFHVSACLRAAVEASIVELLRENPAGLHVKEIAARTGTDATLVARILRLLSAHHVFQEVEPNVFANNLISSIIDTGKSSDFLIELSKRKWVHADPESPVNNVQGEKYINTSGIAAIVEHCTDEGMKCSQYLTQYLLGDSSKVPFSRAFNWDGDFFQFGDVPDHQGYLTRVQAAYAGSSKLEPITAIVHGFDWKALPEGSVVVDVGGGNGSVSFCIAEHAPQLKVVIEDRETTITSVTNPQWNADTAKKNLLDSDRVKLQVHDFFEPQPQHIASNATIFLMRFIIHDWPREAALRILRQLNAAAGPSTRLLLVDQIVPYTCPAPHIGQDILGARVSLPPTPLLANLGMANTMVYYADMMMLNLQGAQERTLGEFIELLSEAGWKIVEIHSPPGSSLKQMECVKA